MDSLAHGLNWKLSVANLTIDALAHENAYLTERIVDLEIDRDAYRALVQAALGHVAQLTVRLDGTVREIARLRTARARSAGAFRSPRVEATQDPHFTADGVTVQ